MDNLAAQPAMHDASMHPEAAGAGNGGDRHTPSEERWLEREKKLFDEIKEAIDYCADQVGVQRYWQRGLSITAMVLGVMAPMLVVGSGTSGALGLPAALLNGLGVIVTFALAVIEGLRRIYRFDQRWAACYNAKATLKRERERYRLERIGLPIGSDPWRANLQRLRMAYDDVTGSETIEFFASVQAEKAAAEGADKEKAAGTTAGKP